MTTMTNAISTACTHSCGYRAGRRRESEGRWGRGRQRGARRPSLLNQGALYSCTAYRMRTRAPTSCPTLLNMKKSIRIALSTSSGGKNCVGAGGRVSGRRQRCCCRPACSRSSQPLCLAICSCRASFSPAPHWECSTARRRAARPSAAQHSAVPPAPSNPNAQHSAAQRSAAQHALRRRRGRVARCPATGRWSWRPGGGGG